VNFQADDRFIAHFLEPGLPRLVFGMGLSV
jgi:hypothetical protein